MGTEGLGWGKGHVKVWREGRSEREQAAARKRELPQQAVPSSSSWSLGSVVAVFILLSQNKSVSGDCGGPSEPSHPADLVRVGLVPSPALYT